MVFIAMEEEPAGKKLWQRGFCSSLAVAQTRASKE